MFQPVARESVRPMMNNDTCKFMADLVEESPVFQAMIKGLLSCFNGFLFFPVVLFWFYYTTVLFLLTAQRFKLSSFLYFSIYFSPLFYECKMIIKIIITLLLTIISRRLSHAQSTNMPNPKL